MLVQLSPFKTVKTSLKISSNSRRRKRNESESHNVPAEVSFVTTSSKRGQLKWKQHSAEFVDSQPIFLVSSDHEISIIGRLKEYAYDEFSSLRYSSRPGSASSFAPSGESAGKLPRIPPILDAKNDMMYALQNGNSRLCCWDALKVHGPDEKNASRVDLLKQAVSMELLPLHKGVIYGTCIDGSIFVARLDQNVDGQDELVVEYLPSKSEKGKASHISTIAQLPQGAVKGGSRKRKMSDADGHTAVFFFQTFRDEHALNLVRHEVQFEKNSTAGGKMIIDHSLKQRVVNIPLVPDAGDTLLEAQMMVFATGNVLTACVTYRVQGREYMNGKTFSAIVSLTAGELKHSRVELPSGTKQCSLIGDSLLAIGTEKSVLLFDIETGSILHTTSVPVNLRGQDWLLQANSKFGTLTLLYEEGNAVYLLVSSLMLDDAYVAAAQQQFSLASKLTSAVLDGQALSQASTAIIIHNALCPQIFDDSSARQSLEQTVRDSLKSLDDARLKILSPSSQEVENYLFMDTYEGSVTTILAAIKSAEFSADGSPRNPQDDDSQSAGVGKNGGALARATKKVKNGLNGIHSAVIPHTKAMTPSLLPQAFIDGATHIVLKLLQCGRVEDDVVGRRVSLARLDARIILHQLLNTGKLSARFHFDGTDSIQASDDEHKLTSVLRSIKLSNKRGRRCFSPVDMIMVMLRRCPDVSERQMVVMLSYTMRRALPEDIAEMFFDERKHYLHNQYADLARKFFSLRSSLYKSRKDNEDVQSPELDRLGRRLVLAGTTYVLYRIVGYSQCNEAMLRVAMQDIIGKSEAIILARCLSNIFASTKRKDLISKAPPSVNAVKSICQWVAALSDTFHDELSAEVSEQKGEKSYLAILLEAINLATRQSQEIISLKDDVRRVESDIQAQLDAKHAPAARALPNPEELPGYSVAKLIF